MKKELAAKYDHQSVEANKYQQWLDKKYFEAGDKTKTPYTIVIPPPNVTGKLHLGHAWDTTLQDMIIRYKRMQGFDALYLPGMDHAGIATQAKVEQRLREQGISRYDLGREKFLEQAWSWKEEYAGFIREQWEKLGLSLDYSKERFTLDEGLSKAVKEVFVTLYNQGLIYQGERIINWDPAQKTALSNIEVIHKEVEGAMYYFKYKIENSDEVLVIATTRPETMFGDQAVFVHPDDSRYQHLIGKNVINPANGELLPIMADSYIDIEFGTAVMKCTPAHDANDFVLGKKYNLAMPKCMNDDGTMNELAHIYKGMDRFECRKKLVEDFTNNGIVDHIEKHIHQVGHSERSDAVVEPYLSKQWFVKMEPLAKQALENQATEGKVNFVPDRFEKTFNQWMENIEDWCISRQLWWGHQVPAWYHKETKEVYVGIEPPKDIENYIQDEDVLDTWFSSALWPFSTLDWPSDEAELYERYFPTDTLVTGYDIIFFWVSRMIFQSLQFTKQRPFKDVLIHGLIRDEQGRKMSKSLGNGVDPIDVIEKYGVDTLRYFLTTNSAPGMDLRYVPEKLESTWNFINKIWNSARFIHMNISEEISFEQLNFSHLNLCDKWILSRLNEVIKEVDTNMDKYEFVNVGSALYKFIWDDYCSWYIELTKVHLQGENEVARKASLHTLIYVMNAIVKMLHPFMPFVTEEIYQSLPHIEESICISSWPQVKTEFDYEGIIDQFGILQELIKGIRELRLQYTIKNKVEIAYSIETKSSSLQNILNECDDYFQRLCNAKCIGVNIQTSQDIATISLRGGHSIIVELGAFVDKEAEKEKLQKQVDDLDKEIARCVGMLNNERFTSKAPQEKIDLEKQKLADYQAKQNTIKEKLSKM